MKYLVTLFRKDSTSTFVCNNFVSRMFGKEFNLFFLSISNWFITKNIILTSTFVRNSSQTEIVNVKWEQDDLNDVREQDTYLQSQSILVLVENFFRVR